MACPVKPCGVGAPAPSALPPGVLPAGSQAFSTSPSPPLPLRFPPRSQENSRTRRALSLPSEAHTLSADWSLGLPPRGWGARTRRQGAAAAAAWGRHGLQPRRDVSSSSRNPIEFCPGCFPTPRPVALRGIHTFRVSRLHCSRTNPKGTHRTFELILLRMFLS